jgi:hypothetical protein
MPRRRLLPGATNLSTLTPPDGNGEPEDRRPVNPLAQAPPVQQQRHHHAGPPTSPPVGANRLNRTEPTTARSDTSGRRRIEAATAACRPSPAPEDSRKGGLPPQPTMPDRSRSSSRRLRIWEEPELCPSPRCQITGRRTRTPRRTAATPAGDAEDEPPTTAGSRRKPRPPRVGWGSSARGGGGGAGGSARVPPSRPLGTTRGLGRIYCQENFSTGQRSGKGWHPSSSYQD